MSALLASAVSMAATAAAEDSPSIDLTGDCRATSGDDLAWAAPDFDDGDWE